MTWPPESLAVRIVVVLLAGLAMWQLCAWMGIPIYIFIVVAGAAAIVVARQIVRGN